MERRISFIMRQIVFPTKAYSVKNIILRNIDSCAKKQKNALLPRHMDIRTPSWGSVNSLAAVMGPPFSLSQLPVIITFRLRAARCAVRRRCRHLKSLRGFVDRRSASHMDSRHSPSGSAGSLTRWWKTGSALDCKSPTRAHTAVGGQHTDQVDAAAALRNLFTSFGD